MGGNNACDRGRGWGWIVYTDIGDNESWHSAKLPDGEKTIVHAVCICVHDLHYICVVERRANHSTENRQRYVHICELLSVKYCKNGQEQPQLGWKLGDDSVTELCPNWICSTLISSTMC